MKCTEGFNTILDEKTIRICSHCEYTAEQEAVMAEIEELKGETLRVIKGICDDHLLGMDPITRWNIVRERVKQQNGNKIVSFNDFKTKKQHTY